HYLAELRRVGRRRGYPRVAREVYRNVDSMIAARALYGRVIAPVDLIYGDHDWSESPSAKPTCLCYRALDRLRFLTPDTSPPWSSPPASLGFSPTTARPAPATKGVPVCFRVAATPLGFPRRQHPRYRERALLRELAA